MNAALEHHLERVLARADGAGTRTLDDARRLCSRSARLAEQAGVEAEDRAPLELACFAIHLSARAPKASAGGKLGQLNLRDRAARAVYWLAGQESLMGDAITQRASEILTQMPARLPTSAAARVLADAVNLDDFGVTGLFLAAMNLARQQAGVSQVAEGFEKREQYGYWEARLKDGFHSDGARQVARSRLADAKRVAEALARELKDDGV